MYDKNFKTELSFFSDKVEFVQTVNLKVANIELSIGFIKEFKKMKERIDTLVMELSHFEKDVLEPVTEDETLKNNV